jgi:hypothetical protein
MYTYATVERTLAKAFAIGPASMGAFRGRIQHLQRLGMVPASPGKGRKISYERKHIYKWALGLELEEFGIDPSLTKFIVESFVWRHAERYLLGDTETSDKLLVFYPNMLSGFAQYADKRIVAAFLCHTVSNLAELDAFQGDPQLQVSSELLSDRLGMINLGRLRRAVREGLASDQTEASAPRRRKRLPSPD